MQPSYVCISTSILGSISPSKVCRKNWVLFVFHYFAPNIVHPRAWLALFDYSFLVPFVSDHHITRARAYKENLSVSLNYSRRTPGSWVDLSAPTILRSRVRIPSTPSMLIQFKDKICAIFVIVLRKDEKNN